MPYSHSPGRRSSLRPLQPLPIIPEDAIEVPVIPQRSPRRLTLNGKEDTPMSMDSMLHSNHGSAPDRRSEAPKEGLMDHEWITKRGGWYRLVLGSLLLVAAIIGLAVGLSIGLGLKFVMWCYFTTGADLSIRVTSGSPAPLPTGVFPAGSYSFTTALTLVSNGCTSNAVAWRCFPFSTFDPARPDLSMATYFWIIRLRTDGGYEISSSDNPFAPSFANISLALLDDKLQTERFMFSFVTGKSVTSSTPLDGSNQVATCRYPVTSMHATIWTRIRASYPANISATAAPVNASNAFAPWPFAVEVTQETTDVPQCRDAKGTTVGGDLRPKGMASTCRCVYVNHGLQLTKGKLGVQPTEMRRRKHR